jgi:hypothetical protein
VTRPAQLHDRLDDLQDQRGDEGLVQRGGRGGRVAEPPVCRLQLLSLRAERRELLPLDLRHQVERGDVVRCPRQGLHVDEGERVKPRGRVVATAGFQRRGDLEAGPHRLGEQLKQDLVLAGEVVVQRRLPDADPLGDLPGRRRGQALADEQAGRRVEYLLPRRHAGVARRAQPGTARAPPVPESRLWLARRASRVRHACDYRRTSCPQAGVAWLVQARQPP